MRASCLAVLFAGLALGASARADDPDYAKQVNDLDSQALRIAQSALQMETHLKTYYPNGSAPFSFPDLDAHPGQDLFTNTSLTLEFVPIQGPDCKQVRGGYSQALKVFPKMQQKMSELDRLTAQERPSAQLVAKISGIVDQIGELDSELAADFPDSFEQEDRALYYKWTMQGDTVPGVPWDAWRSVQEFRIQKVTAPDYQWEIKHGPLDKGMWLPQFGLVYNSSTPSVALEWWSDSPMAFSRQASPARACLTDVRIEVAGVIHVDYRIKDSSGAWGPPQTRERPVIFFGQATQNFDTNQE